jgi:hypothetical protein
MTSLRWACLAAVLLLALVCATASAGQTRRFLHITDIHWDKFYVVGTSVTDLCHSHGGRRTLVAADDQAGTFGARGCDSPYPLVTAALQFARSLGPLDFVVWTGDNARHNRDKAFLPTSQDEILYENTQVTQWMQQSFPSLTLVPSIGNNDVYPHDSLGPGPNAILSNLTANWRQWLSPASQQTMSQGGYFATQVAPGLQIISLNTIYWASFNTETKSCSHNKYPGAQQFAWLDQTLSAIRQSGQKVYLTGHVPPHKDYYFDSCLEAYETITANYADIIVGHLFGHKHSDHLYVLKNQAGAILVAPSVLPQYNPSLRVIEYDSSSYEIMNVITYWANLDAANAQGSLTFKKEYDMVSAYGLSAPLDTAQWLDMKQKTDNDPAMAKLYGFYKYVSSGMTKATHIPGHPNC